MSLSAQFVKQRPWLFALCIATCAHVGLLVLLGEQRLPNQVASANQAQSRIIRFRTLQRSADHHTPESAQTTTLPTTKEEQASSATPLLEPERVSNENSLPNVVAQQPDSANIAAPALAEAYYYMPSDLTAKPVFLSEGDAPGPAYLPDIHPAPVVVHLLISETGSVDAVVLEDAFLSDAAKKFITDTFAAMKFSPGLLGTYPVKSQIVLEARLDSIMQLK